VVAGRSIAAARAEFKRLSAAPVEDVAHPEDHAELSGERRREQLARNAGGGRDDAGVELTLRYSAAGFRLIEHPDGGSLDVAREVHLVAAEGVATSATSSTGGRRSCRRGAEANETMAAARPRRGAHGSRVRGADLVSNLQRP